MTVPPNDPAPERTLLRVATVARQLDLSIRTVWKLIAAGKLPVVHLAPRVTRVRQSDLDAFVAQGRKEVAQ